MNCLHPVTIKNFMWDNEHQSEFWKYLGKYGHLPPKFVLVPCGHCMNCYHKKRLDWTIRMEKELKVSSSCFFITCTYSDEFLPRTKSGRPTLSKRDHQLFLKRLRKKYGEGIRYYMCGEYGSNFDRPHLHYVLYNLPLDLLERAELVRYHPSPVYISPDLTGIWANGSVEIGEITSGGMSYVAKYCQWREESDLSVFDDDQVKPFSLQSRNPGIGEDYITEGWKSPFMYRDGVKVATPRYYRDKMDLPKEYEIESIFDDHTMQDIKNMYYNEKLYFNYGKERKKDFASSTCPDSD